MTASARPDAPGAGSRFRLPVRFPARTVTFALLVAFAGSIEVIIWATLQMPPVFLIFGVSLMVLGTGLGAWLYLRHRSQQWVLYVGVTTLLVTGVQRREIPWSQIGGVALDGHRLVVSDREGGRLLALPVDAHVRQHPMLTALLQTVESRRPAR